MSSFHLRLAMIGVGVLGLGVFLLNKQLDAGEPNEICFSANITLLNVSAGSCLNGSNIRSMLNAPVLQRTGSPVPLKMTPPNSITSKTPIETCADYVKKVKQGWYSLSQRDMDRESVFSARCGLLTALARARTSRSSFVDGKKGLTDLDLLPSGLLPELNETRYSIAEAPPGRMVKGRSVADLVAAGECVIKQAMPGHLSLSTKTSDISISELARADFNGDGYEDMLVLVSTKLKGGTAGFSEVQGLTRRGPSGLLESFPVEIR